MRRAPDIDWALCASVVRLLQNGLSYQVVAETTGLSIGQVSYRASALDVHPGDFRRGRTAQAKAIIESTACAKHNMTATRGEKYKVKSLNVEELRQK